MNLAPASDSVIAAVAPGWAARRAQARQAIALATYRGAEINRLTKDWDARSRSADAAIIGDRKTLDARNRQLMRDDPNAAAIRRSYVRNVVGRGITARAAARDVNGNVFTEFNRKLDARWYDWARNPKLVDRERRRDFAGIQRWAIGEMIECGEAILIISYESRPKQCGLVLQCVDPDQLDNVKLQHGDNEVRGGVEVDAYGAAVAYHIYPRHPYDYASIAAVGSLALTLQSVRIPADRIIHVFDPERVRQTRGVSRLTSVMLKLRDLNEYDYAQLVAAKAEACIGLAVTSPDGAGTQIGLAEDGANSEDDDDGNDQLAMQPLMVARLRTGEDIKPFTPTRPGNLYGPFVLEQKRTIAAGAGLSYEQVSRDFSQGTYSSQRQTSNEDRREFEPLQDLLIMHLCQPVREKFIEFSVVWEGALTAPGFAANRDDWTYTNWRPQGWQWVDKKNEADAEDRAIERGITSTIAVADAHGDDAYEIADQQAAFDAYREQAKAKARAKLGLAPVVADPSAPPTSATAAPPEATDTGVADPNAPAAGVTAVERIAGVDAERAEQMLGRVSRGEASPDIVRTILVGMGFTDQQAADMTAKAEQFKPAESPQPAGAMA